MSTFLGFARAISHGRSFKGQPALPWTVALGVHLSKPIKAVLFTMTHSFRGRKRLASCCLFEGLGLAQWEERWVSNNFISPPNFSKRFFDCVPGANGFCAISANFLFSFGLFSLATIFNDTGIFKQQTSCYFAHNNFNASLFLIILCPLSKFSLTVRVPSATGVTCILSCTYHCSPSPL